MKAPLEKLIQKPFKAMLLLGVSLIPLVVTKDAFTDEGRIGNGGGAWVCQNQDASHSIRWSSPVDLYEAQIEFRLPIADFRHLKTEEILNEMLRRMHYVSPEWSRDITQELGVVRSNLTFIDADLQFIDDARMRVRPAEKDCADGKVGYVQVANYSNYGKVLIQKSVFTDPTFTTLGQAALLLHEAVYADLRKRLKDQDSVLTRRLVGLLFSALNMEKIKAEVLAAFAARTSGGVTGMKFVAIPAGSFWMGDYNPSSNKSTTITSGPRHHVTLTRGFEMQTTTVTQQQYFEVMGTNPIRTLRDRCPDSFRELDNQGEKIGICPNFPVIGVTTDDIKRFLTRLNYLRQDGYHYDLPTEAQWEYAARAGSTGDYSFGNDPKILPLYAWFSENSGGRIHEVGQLRPNRFGLYDMEGNASQWVKDFAADYPTGPVVDPVGPATGYVHVARGCAGDNFHTGTVELCAVHKRQLRDSNSNSVINGIGFRLIRTKK